MAPLLFVLSLSCALCLLRVLAVHPGGHGSEALRAAGAKCNRGEVKSEECFQRYLQGLESATDATTDLDISKRVHRSWWHDVFFAFYSGASRLPGDLHQ